MKNCATNFRVGLGVPKHIQYTTSYEAVTGSANQYGQQVETIGDVAAKRTSILLGHSGKNGFVTTNQRLFSCRDPSGAIQPPNKDFIASIKASHFDVGYPRTRSILETKRHYLSEANLSYNNKGNAAELRSKLDEVKKNDLRKNHFEIGGPTAAFKHPTSSLAFRPSTALER